MAGLRTALLAGAESRYRDSTPDRKPGAPKRPRAFSLPWAGRNPIREDDMKRKRVEYRKPYGRGDYELVRGAEGVYWQAGHGLVVRLASAEREQGTETWGLSGEARALEVGPSITAL
jgi:hypothetical protein